MKKMFKWKKKLGRGERKKKEVKREGKTETPFSSNEGGRGMGKKNHYASHTDTNFL